MRSIWASILRNNIQAIIASQTDCELQELAQLADNIMKRSNNLTFINPRRHPPHQHWHPSLPLLMRSTSYDWSDRRTDAADTCAYCAAAHAQSFYVTLPLSPTSPFNSRSNNRDALKLCWYHQRFQDIPTNYQPPCSFKGNQQAVVDGGKQWLLYFS